MKDEKRRARQSAGVTPALFPKGTKRGARPVKPVRAMFFPPLVFIVVSGK
jgi:hypothetical protein